LFYFFFSPKNTSKEVNKIAIGVPVTKEAINKQNVPNIQNIIGKSIQPKHPIISIRPPYSYKSSIPAS